VKGGQPQTPTGQFQPQTPTGQFQPQGTNLQPSNNSSFNNAPANNNSYNYNAPANNSSYNMPAGSNGMQSQPQNPPPQTVQGTFGPGVHQAVVGQVMSQPANGRVGVTSNIQTGGNANLDGSRMNLLDESRDNISQAPVYNYGRNLDNSSYRI
jgi:hypothetical protein